MINRERVAEGAVNRFLEKGNRAPMAFVAFWVAIFGSVATYSQWNKGDWDRQSVRVAQACPPDVMSAPRADVTSVEVALVGSAVHVDEPGSVLGSMRSRKLYAIAQMWHEAEERTATAPYGDVIAPDILRAVITACKNEQSVD